MGRATLRPKGQVTLPNDVREALHVEEGDEIEFEVADSGVVIMHGLKMIPAEQAWFWTETWHTGERAATDDIRAGRLSKVYQDIDDMFDDLDGRR